MGGQITILMDIRYMDIHTTEIGIEEMGIEEMEDIIVPQITEGGATEVMEEGN